MSVILDILKTIFGLGTGGSVVNNIGGTLTHLAALPALAWLATHANEQVQVSTSYGFLALIGGFVYVLLEVLRRSRGSA